MKTFFEKCKTAFPSVHGLGLDSNPPTVPLSRQIQTPGPMPPCFDDGKIGRGNYGVVHRYVDTRTGQFYATKKFIAPAPAQRGAKKRRLDIAWIEKIRNEINIMKENPHVSFPPALVYKPDLIS